MAETPTDRIKQCLNLHHLDLFCVLGLPFSTRPNDIYLFCFAYGLETQTGKFLNDVTNSLENFVRAPLFFLLCTCRSGTNFGVQRDAVVNVQSTYICKADVRRIWRLATRLYQKWQAGAM